MLRSLFRNVIFVLVTLFGFIAGGVLTMLVVGMTDLGREHISIITFLGALLGAVLAHRGTSHHFDQNDRLGRLPRYDYTQHERWNEYTTSKPVVEPEGEMFHLSRHVYGQIGGTMEQAGFSDANSSAGMVGEVKTSEIIENLMTQADQMNTKNHAYLFRGLIWPGSKNADVDFILAYPELYSTQRARLLMIDAKQWKRGDYRWDGQMCYLDGKPYHEIKFGNAIDAVRREFPECWVDAVVVIHGAMSTSNNPGSDLRIMTPEEFIDYVRKTCFFKTTGHVSSAVGKRLASMVKVADKNHSR